jgi:hypothetical protein
MLQHTDQFWSRISYQRTMWQHCSIPHTQLSPADIYPFPRLELAVKERCFCDATGIIKNATEELKKTFTKWLPGMFPTSSQSKVYRCTTGVILKKMQPQCLYCSVRGLSGKCPNVENSPPLRRPSGARQVLPSSNEFDELRRGNRIALSCLVIVLCVFMWSHVWRVWRFFSEIKFCREHSEANAYIRTYLQDLSISVDG